MLSARLALEHEDVPDYGAAGLSICRDLDRHDESCAVCAREYVKVINGHARMVPADVAGAAPRPPPVGAVMDHAQMCPAVVAAVEHV